MNYKDYYKILGVGPHASQSDIKQAYRAMAHRYHPDTGHGDALKFKEVNEAYEFLSDETKRRVFHQWYENQQTQSLNNAGVGNNSIPDSKQPSHDVPHTKPNDMSWLTNSVIVVVIGLIGLYYLNSYLDQSLPKSAPSIPHENKIQVDCKKPQPLPVSIKKIYDKLFSTVSIAPGSQITTAYQSGSQGESRVDMTASVQSNVFSLRMQSKDGFYSIGANGEKNSLPGNNLVIIRDANLDGLPDDFRYQDSMVDLHEYCDSQDQSVIKLLWGIGTSYLVDNFVATSSPNGLTSTEPNSEHAPFTQIKTNNESTKSYGYAEGWIEDVPGFGGGVSGWAFDNNKPYNIDIAFQNMSNPSSVYHFTDSSEKLHTSNFLFMNRSDVDPIIIQHGFSPQVKTGFQLNLGMLPVGTYKIISATYNEKPFSFQNPDKLIEIKR